MYDWNVVLVASAIATSVGNVLLLARDNPRLVTPQNHFPSKADAAAWNVNFSKYQMAQNRVASCFTDAVVKFPKKQHTWPTRKKMQH